MKTRMDECPGRSIIQAALSFAELHPEHAVYYQLVALNCSYNLSAGCWPAWGDDVLVDNPGDIEMGLELAHFNVELGAKIKVGPDRRKNGSWMVPGHGSFDGCLGR